MRKKEVFRRSTIVLILLVFVAARAFSGDRPNIIFLLTDDQRWDTFGFMGNKTIITPNCDKLAAEGVVFENTLHATPICQPSRASIQLGQYLNTHRCGFDAPTQNSISQQEWMKSFPVLLRESGYFTGFVGKFGYPVSAQKTKNRVNEDLAIDKGVDSQLWKREECMPKDSYDRWLGFPGQGTYHVNGKHGTEDRGDKAIAFIRAAANQKAPFALQVSFKAPHSPFSPAPEFLAMYENTNIPRHDNDLEEAFERLPEVVRTKYRGRKGYVGDEAFQNFITRYYALITGVDHVVGRIREELKSLGLDENTIIIYSSDNGYFCGSKQLSGKDLLYEESIKAPLIIYDPRQPASAGITKRQGITSTIDIAPTILGYAGLKAPSSMQGKSLLPLVSGTKNQVHKAVYGENNFANFSPVISDFNDPAERDAFSSVRSKYVRTPQFKYIRYHECTPVVEELWKITKDPQEKINLVGNPEYSSVLKKMRKMLDKFETSTRGMDSY